VHREPSKESDPPTPVGVREEDITMRAKVCYNFLAFFAYWFGASRFDMDGDGDFDAADVQAMMNGGKKMLRLNFTRPPKDKKARAKRRRAREAKKRQREAEMAESDAAHQEIIRTNGESGGVGGTALNIFEHALYGAERLGRKGDNILEAEVEDEAQEDEIMENLKQYWPYFTIIEVLLCLGFWGVNAFYARSYSYLPADSASSSYYWPMTLDTPGRLLQYTKDDLKEELFLDDCKKECNTADSDCVGISWRKGPFAECYLLSALPTDTSTAACTDGSSYCCETDTWGRYVLAKEAWNWYDSLMMKGGLETVFPGYTTLASYSYCYEGYDISLLWRWWSYQFTHGSITHVGANCMMTIILGIPLEGWHGTGMFAVMWTIGVLGGAFCWAVFDPYTTSYGASGGCYSLLGMHAADLILNWGDKKWRWGTIFVMLLVAGVETLLYWANRDEESSTAHCVHVGGLVAGLLIGFCGGRNDHVKVWEYVCIAIGWILGAILVGGSLFFWYGSPLDNEAPAIGSLWNPSERPFCWIGTVCVDDNGNHCPMIDDVSTFATNADDDSNGKTGQYNTMHQCVMCQTRECVEGWYSETYKVTESDGETITEHYKYCPQKSSRTACPFTTDDGFDVWYPPTKSTFQLANTPAPTPTPTPAPPTSTSTLTVTATPTSTTIP
jgi:membrane associated rhomboid family serine protease